MSVENSEQPASAERRAWRVRLPRPMLVRIYFVLPLVAFATPLLLSLTSHSPLRAYPFTTNLPLGLMGLYDACLGVLQLAWADLGKNPTGQSSRTAQVLSGGTLVWIGLGIFGMEFLPLLLRPSRVPDWYFVVWIFLTVIVLLAVAVQLVLRRIRQGRGDTHSTSPTVPRISRRTLLLGSGVVGIGATGIGTLLARLPTMIARVTYRQSQHFPAALAWSPDGHSIASAGTTAGAQTWDAATGNTIAHHQQRDIHAISWSPDSRRIASATWDNDSSIQIWDAATGETLLTYTETEGRTAAWSPRDERVATTTRDNSIHIFDAATAKTLVTLGKSLAGGVVLAWSPDARYIATDTFGQGSPYTIWETATGRQIATYRTGHFLMSAIAWSPDGTHIATAGQDGSARVWRVQDGTLVTTYRGHGAAVNAIAWSPDGRFIASGGEDDTIQVWRADSGRRVFTWNGHLDTIRQLGWDPSGRFVASGSFDSTIQVWQPRLS